MVALGTLVIYREPSNSITETTEFHGNSSLTMHKGIGCLSLDLYFVPIMREINLEIGHEWGFVNAMTMFFLRPSYIRFEFRSNGELCTKFKLTLGLG